MNIDKFINISMRGRVAYGISCLENALLSFKYDLNDWKIVLNYLWEFTSIQYLDDWNDAAVELIPENLLEFRMYEEHEFERLSKQEFVYLYNLYQDIDVSIDKLIRSIYELGVSHVYTEIEGYGESSLKSLERLVNVMFINNFPLPSIEPFLKYSIKENRGWGNKFEGLSR
ncbi:hypothetical protein [Paenibacillus sp. KS-LC4]|uniref:hypothetical protein n=1 Tax=Paenibacillus sp. KS-LC4 TaxID=2979727 RepID=UPI0030CC3C53